jgi:hypothetical protein
MNPHIVLYNFLFLQFPTIFLQILKLLKYIHDLFLSNSHTLSMNLFFKTKMDSHINYPN